MDPATLTLLNRPLLHSRDRGELAVRRFRVRRSAGSSRTTELTAATVVGSAQDADVRLESPTVSRRHVRLTPTVSGVIVEDLASKNGTFLQGVRVSEALIERSSVLRLGSCDLQVIVEDETVTSVPGLGVFGELVGESPVMQALFARLALVARSDSSLLLLGETGTGKSAIARALHEQSHRRNGPFVSLECGSLSEELADATLFGHVRGAFTGADRDRPGVFQRAQGGTLFLQDVGAMSPALQPRLLRALESHSVQRVGGTERELIDVRIIASASPRLRHTAFRSDLYYRLAVVELTVPPLRDRVGDVVRLASRFAARLGSTTPPPDLLEGLEHHPWPGNVRELINHVERSLVLGGVPRGSEDLARAVGPGEPKEPGERQRVEAALMACAWNQSAAAKLLGISRGTLISRIERYKLPRPRAK
ncbi:MAG: sigma 54-interacting transcriptional regulator [Archangium sp.]|nr:sigma 54-interacting transcriptional regulator [Archangium sp.]